MSRALTAHTDVIVDLRELTFADSSLMLDLAMVARRLRKAGRRLHLRSAQPQVWRLIEVVGLDRLPGVVADEQTPAPGLSRPAARSPRTGRCGERRRSRSL